MSINMFGYSYRRHGITPVVSIVMLLMMTVAAAGAAYSWFNQIQTDVQEQATNRLQTSIEVRDLQCLLDTDPSDDGNTQDDLLISLKNTGRRDLSGRSVDIYVYDNNGELYAAITGQNFRTGANWQMASPSGTGFLESGGFGQVLVDMPSGAQFTNNAFYTVDIAFSDSNLNKPVGGCIAS